jgi:hypothetical protein
MPGIDWTYLGSIGGGGLEDFVATCLRQRHTDARQTRPASGDGGIDIVRETPDGLVVWQVKRFTTPLTSSQKQQVKRSWKRFWNTHVAAGTLIQAYFLATPWTPTDGMLDWFQNEICAEAMFPVRWEGEAFFNALAADFPATADRFFKGPDMLESMVNAKAILAASPAESADQTSMLQALAARDVAIREIRDMVSDNYHLDTGTRSGFSGEVMPFPSPDESGIFYRYTSLGDNRWYVESVVPRNAQSTEIEPISLDIRFIFEPGSDDERKIEEWRAWGIPFRDVEAETHQRGGPWQEAEPQRGVVSFQAASGPLDYPDLEIKASTSSGEDKRMIVLAVTEVSRGVVGLGLRVHAVSKSGILEIDIRVASDTAPDRIDIRVLPAEGLHPEAVRDELIILGSFAGEDSFKVAIANGPTLLTGSKLMPAPSASLILAVASDLALLQTHTREQFLMPTLDTVTDAQLDQMHRLAEIYEGNAFQTTWERLAITVKEPSGIQNVPFDGTGVLMLTEQPKFNLGANSYTITRLLATQYLTPTLPTGIDRAALEPGDEVELLAGADNRLVVAAVVDDLAQP